jgi:hypothetical protein
MSAPILTTNTCQNCKFSWHAGSWYCRRMPPMPIVAPGPGGQPTIASTFPVIQPELTCGEHKPKITLAN